MQSTTSAETKAVHAIGCLPGRLKEAREALGYTQKGIAEAAGSKLRSWQDYEAGKKVPGSAVIAGLAGLGVNANWLLTGEGSVLADGHSAPAGGFDRDLIRTVVLAIEEALDELDLEMDPDAKADLVLLVYDLYADTGGQPDKAKVIRLVKSAA